MQSYGSSVMPRQRSSLRRCIALLVSVVGLMVTTLNLQAEQKSDAAMETAQAAVDGEVPAGQAAAVAAARQRAELMHAIYAETLHVMHERYFHGSRAVVPARAMEDIFKTMKRQAGVEARWMSVNVRAMSIHHQPKTEFELAAAKDIAAGKPAVEAIADGYYRRAGAIEMTAGCVACHDGFGKPPTTVPKFAALVISIPVASDAPESPDSPEPLPPSDR